MNDNYKYTRVIAGERLDLISKRIYGIKTKYKLLIQANPKLNIFNPQPGFLIRIPNA